VRVGDLVVARHPGWQPTGRARRRWRRSEHRSASPSGERRPRPDRAGRPRIALSPERWRPRCQGAPSSCLTAHRASVRKECRAPRSSL